MKFKPGQSGNPMGRPKGSRNKVGELFYSELYSDFQDHGRDAIIRMREERPHDYIKVIASLLPKDMTINTNPYEHLTDEELQERIAEIREIIALEAKAENVN